MTNEILEDLARFEMWLEQYATDEERKLPYDDQMKMHILWLSGNTNDMTILEQIPEDEFGSTQ